MALTPAIYVGSLLVGANDFVPSGMASSIAIQNRDSDLSFTIKINNSTNGWTLDPGDKLGLRIKNGIFKVTLTPVSGTPAYQLLFS